MALLAGCAAPAPAPRADFEFGLLGDTPYSQAQANLLDEVIRDMNAEPLSFVVHVGDITSGGGPCSDDWLEARRQQFARIRHPFVLLPGDNEWTDCHRTGFDPLERLRKWRSLFCLPKQNRLVEIQPGEYCEHVRWRVGGALFVGLNVPGSNNNLGRTKAMDAEHARRMAAALTWLEEGARLAAEKKLQLVVLCHGDPFAHRAPDGYAELMEKLSSLAKTQGPITLVHGDTHVYRNDEPLPGVRRIEVEGSPAVSWLRAWSGAGGIGAERAHNPKARTPSNAQ